MAKGFQMEKMQNEADFNRAFGTIKRIILEEALPFFEEYSALEAVNKKVESMPISEPHTFIDPYIPFKRLILKKLCNNPDWAEYGQKPVEFYKVKAVEQPRNYLHYDKAILRLMKILISL